MHRKCTDGSGVSSAPELGYCIAGWVTKPIYNNYKLMRFKSQTGLPTSPPAWLPSPLCVREAAWFDHIGISKAHSGLTKLLALRYWCAKEGMLSVFQGWGCCVGLCGMCVAGVWDYALESGSSVLAQALPLSDSLSCDRNFYGPPTGL